jgi:ATP diphosphatase
MEALAERNGTSFATLDLDAQEALWQAVKRSERGETP